MQCSYDECTEDAILDPETSKDAMQFCKQHDDEFTQLVKSEDARGILRFWIKAQGGAKKAAQRMIGA